MALTVARDVIEQIEREARQAHPEECCGILLGEKMEVTQAHAAGNAHPTPATHFEIDPQALIDAHRAAREDGPQVLGYYHSHPTGVAVPSETDWAMAAHDGKVWAIIDADGVRLWRDEPDGFHALSYDIVAP